MNKKELVEKGESQDLEFKESLRLKEKKVVMIEVRESQEKPVFFKNHAYKRVGKKNHRISSNELRKLAKESGERVYWDERVCEEASLEDIEEEKVKTFIMIAKEERNLRIGENIPTKEVLRKLKLVKEDKLTNAGVLLFGKEPQRFFTQSEVRCARFKGDEAVKPFVDMKVFGGDIINQVDKALNFTLEHIPKSVWLIPGRPEREEKYLYPPDAVREAIINLNLNERQKKAVEFIKTEKKITRSEYEKMFCISERTANRELSNLVKLSILNKTGKGPNVCYELTKISPNLAKSRQKEGANIK
ncbi:hypothetical protein ES705_04282 [subsurface metagenome]|nr:hypothetical protein [Methanosarcinales archaeon]